MLFAMKGYNAKRFARKAMPRKRRQPTAVAPEERRIIVRDPRALEELKRNLGIKTAVQEIEIAISNENRVFAFFGSKKHRIRKKISSKTAPRIIRNLFAWEQFLKKHGTD